jgi:fucose 4-O-acetylase-like acetyltransferase
MERRRDIDSAKALAILLVVFGHLVARADPAGVDWYEPLRRAVYAFHMPFFLYLSGLVAVLSGQLLAPHARWPAIFRARARRLLLPFFGLGALIVLGKILAARVMFVDNPPASLASGLTDLLWHTSASPASSIWYLFVLFTVSLAAMALLAEQPARIAWLLALFLLLYAAPLPAYCYLDRIGGFAIFFALCAAAGLAVPAWTRVMDRLWPLALALFLPSLVLIAWAGSAWPEKLILLPIGALSMPAIHGLLRHFDASSARLFTFAGRNSFMIYLFNTPCIGLAKGLLLAVCGWDGTNFLPFAAALMLAGIFGPIALKTQLRRIPVLDRLSN